MLGYLINTMRDRGAEDVHQQVFLEVWQRAPDYDPERASVLTWIMTIARSRAIDELRRRRPEPHDPATASTWRRTPTPTSIPTPWSSAGGSRTCFRACAPRRRSCLRMRFYEGLSQSEIAERTGIALGTVKMRMVAALRRLRDLIEEEEEAVRP